MRLIIASRKSDLARIQAYMVGEALKKKNLDLEIEYQFSSSLGDENQDDPLWKMPSQGVFTQDFRAGLANGNVDMVVHSWKDLPTESDGSIILAATLPRADPADLLLIKKTAIEGIKKSKKIWLLSSSPRRMFNLESFLKKAFPNGLNEVEFSSVRGNIQTRLSKMLELEVDGLIVAKAAIDRLLTSDQWSRANDNFEQSALAVRNVIDKCEWMVLPISANPPAAAQGALVVEIAQQRKDLIAILDEINCKQTFTDVSIERSILSSYGGGCHQKIGVWVKTLARGRVFSIRGESDNGESIKQFSLVNSKELSKNIALKDIYNPNRLIDIFSREDILPSADSLQKISKADVLFLASSHIPDDYLTKIKNHKIWASGVASWIKLAAKNIWVNGVDDNLGACVDRQIETLLNLSPNWLTLTHADSPSKPAIGTYKLIPNSNDLNIKDETHFYWRSGSSFRRALELEPKIKDKNHACGMGQTYSIIKEILGDGANVTPFINEDEWLKVLHK